MNNCNFVGKIVSDLDIKILEEFGTCVLKFKLSVNKFQQTNYFNFEIWDKGAEYMLRNLKKGDLVWLNCEAKQESWEKEGVTRTKIVFRVNSFGKL